MPWELVNNSNLNKTPLTKPTLTGISTGQSNNDKTAQEKVQKILNEVCQQNITDINTIMTKLEQGIGAKDWNTWQNIKLSFTDNNGNPIELELRNTPQNISTIEEQKDEKKGNSSKQEKQKGQLNPDTNPFFPPPPVPNVQYNRFPSGLHYNNNTESHNLEGHSFSSLNYAIKKNIQIAANKTFFNMSDSEIGQLLNSTWKSICPDGLRPEPDGTLQPDDGRYFWIVPMNRQIGTSGETNLKIIASQHFDQQKNLLFWELNNAFPVK